MADVAAGLRPREPLKPKQILRRWWTSPVSLCLRMGLRAGGWRTPLAGVLLLLGAGLPALEMVALGVLVSSLPATIHAGFSSAAGQKTIQALAFWGALMVLLQIIPRIRTAIVTAMGWRLDSALRQRTMAAVNRPWGIAHLEDPKVAALISQTGGIGVTGYTPGTALNQLINMRIGVTLSALISGALLIGYHWWAALLLVGSLYAFNGVRRGSYTRMAGAVVGQTPGVMRAEYFRNLALSPGSAKDVRLLGIGDWIIGRLRAEWQGGLAERQKAEGQAFPLTIAGSVVVTGVSGLIFGLLARDAATGAIGMGALVVYLRAASSLGALGQSGAADSIIAHGSAAVPAILELERRTAPPPGPALASLPPSAPARDIRFERVSFTYAGAATPVLKDLNLTIPTGQSMALVGLNGAGKTTLVKLLARLYDPTSGAILVDGIDLRDADPKDWQKRIAAIFQDFLKYGLPARDNIGFGGLAMAGDQAALERAAAKAGVLERIQGLPAGWDTPLSRHFTGGADLSGGEWQRIGLARALFAVEAGASVLILDEPTANLDVRAEAELYDRFLDMTKGLTTLLISHRFSTVRRADRICVLEDGAVLELGTHDELMAKGGRYAEMFTLQSQRFVDAGASA